MTNPARHFMPTSGRRKPVWISRPTFGLLKKGKQDQGMTLVELLVALAVGTMLLLLVLGIYDQTVQLWLRSEANLAVARQAAVTTEILAADLKQFVAYSGIASMSTQSIHGAEPGSEDPGSSQLHFLATLVNEGTSEVCAVSYRCEYDANIGGYVLRRYLMDSDQLNSRIQRIHSSEKGTVSDAAALYAVDSTTRDSEKIAAYVWNFQVSLVDQDGKEIPAETVTLLDASYPASIVVSFDVLAPSKSRIRMAKSGSKEFWQHPTSHLYQQTVSNGILRVTQKFALPKGAPFQLKHYPDPPPKNSGSAD